MDKVNGILPGARVRNGEGFLGTVERLEQSGTSYGTAPDVMVVRSDDGQWRYSIPVMLVREINQKAFAPVVRVAMPTAELAFYLIEHVAPQPAAPGEVPDAPADPWATVDPDAPTVAGEAWPGQDTVIRDGAGGATPSARDDELVIPIVEEELVVHKQPVVQGMVHVHKGVATIAREMQVPVYHEEAIVEHIPAAEYDATAPQDPSVVIIPVVEERLVVQKQTVVREYLRVRKDLVSRQFEVRGEVRREVVDVTREMLGSGDAEHMLHLPLEESPAAEA